MVLVSGEILFPESYILWPSWINLIQLLVSWARYLGFYLLCSFWHLSIKMQMFRRKRRPASDQSRTHCGPILAELLPKYSRGTRLFPGYFRGTEKSGIRIKLVSSADQGTCQHFLEELSTFVFLFAKGFQGPTAKTSFVYPRTLSSLLVHFRAVFNRLQRWHRRNLLNVFPQACFPRTTNWHCSLILQNSLSLVEKLSMWR